MDYGDKARELHNDEEKKLNCAQSVLCALCDKTGVDYESSRLVAAGFGGGMRCGEVCGAIAGGIMSLGAALGDGDGSSGGETTKYVKMLTKAFRADYGTLRCAELIKAADGHKRCDEFITYCARQVSKIIEENK